MVGSGGIADLSAIKLSGNVVVAGRSTCDQMCMNLVPSFCSSALSHGVFLSFADATRNFVAEVTSAGCALTPLATHNTSTKYEPSLPVCFAQLPATTCRLAQLRRPSRDQSVDLQSAFLQICARRVWRLIQTRREAR